MPDVEAWIDMSVVLGPGLSENHEEFSYGNIYSRGSNIL